MDTKVSKELYDETQAAIDYAMGQIKTLAKLVAASTKKNIPDDPYLLFNLLRRVVNSNPMLDKGILDSINRIEFLADLNVLNLQNFRTMVFNINLTTEMSK